jgi:hypothetical protein
MITNYYTYDKTTLEVDRQPKKLIKQSEMDELPMAALLVKPLEPAQGKAVVVCEFDEAGRPQSTKYVDDHRGKYAYSTSQPYRKEKVDYVGEIKEGWTLKERATEFDDWVNDDWVTDESKLNEHLASIEQVEMMSELNWVDIQLKYHSTGDTKRATISLDSLNSYAIKCRDYVQNIDGVLTIVGDKPVRPTE